MLAAPDDDGPFAGDIDVFLRPRPDLKNLIAIRGLVKELDRIGNSLRRVVAEISRGLDVEPSQVMAHLAKAGVPVNVIKELAGHKSIETTLRYMHTDRAAKRGAIDALRAARSDLESPSTSG